MSLIPCGLGEVPSCAQIRIPHTQGLRIKSLGALFLRFCIAYEATHRVTCRGMVNVDELQLLLLRD